MNATNEEAEINATIEGLQGQIKNLKSQIETLNTILKREQNESMDWFKRYKTASEDAELFKELLKQIINKN